LEAQSGSMDSRDPRLMRARWDEINRGIDDCLHSDSVVECLEQLLHLTRDRVVAYVVARKYEEVGDDEKANALFESAFLQSEFERIPWKDEELIRGVRDALLDFRHRMSRPLRLTKHVQRLDFFIQETQKAESSDAPARS